MSVILKIYYRPPASFMPETELDTSKVDVYSLSFSQVSSLFRLVVHIRSVIGSYMALHTLMIRRLRTYFSCTENVSAFSSNVSSWWNLEPSCEPRPALYCRGFYLFLKL